MPVSRRRQEVSYPDAQSQLAAKVFAEIDLLLQPLDDDVEAMVPELFVTAACAALTTRDSSMSGAGHGRLFYVPPCSNAGCDHSDSPQDRLAGTVQRFPLRKTNSITMRGPEHDEIGIPSEYDHQWAEGYPENGRGVRRQTRWCFNIRPHCQWPGSLTTDSALTRSRGRFSVVPFNIADMSIATAGHDMARPRYPNRAVNDSERANRLEVNVASIAAARHHAGVVGVPPRLQALSRGGPGPILRPTAPASERSPGRR